MKLAMTIKEVSASLSLGESTIRKLIAEGNFPKPFYVGDSPRFRVKEIEEWLDNPPPKKKKTGRPRLAV